MKVYIRQGQCGSSERWKRRQDPVLQSLIQATRNFKIVRGNSVVMYYDPDLDSFEVALFRIACQKEVAAIEKLFGTFLLSWWGYGPRLRVYVFPTCDAVSKVYGAPAGGFASWSHWSIAVNLEPQWEEIIRHEVAHIMAARWNPYAMTFLCEGLAVWAERSRVGMPIDDCAKQVLRHPKIVNEYLHNPPPPRESGEVHSYYAVAGSFTSTLIRRFGLDRYQRFYSDRSINNETIERGIQRHFGVPMPTFVRQWLADVEARTNPITIHRSST